MAKLVNNRLITAITGLVFDAFDLGSALDVNRERLGEVLAHRSSANPSVGITSQRVPISSPWQPDRPSTKSSPWKNRSASPYRGAVTDDAVADWMTYLWCYRRFALREPHLYAVMFGPGLAAFTLGRVAATLELPRIAPPSHRARPNDSLGAFV